MTTERSPALVRSRNRVLGGVCAGVAERVGVDPLLVRLLTVLLALISAGAVVVGYVVLWALLPEAAPQRPALAAGPTPPAAETAETAGTAEAPTVEMAAQVPAVEAPTVAGISETPLADPRGAWTAVGGELRAFAGELRRAHPTGDTTATDPTAAQPTATAEGADSRPAPLKAADRAMSAVGEQLRAPEVRSSARQVAARLSDAVRISADDLRRRTRGSG